MGGRCPPDPPLWDLTQHAPGGWSQKSRVRAGPGHRRRCLIPSFSLSLFEGTNAVWNEGTRRGCPLKKVLPFMEIVTKRTHKKKE